MRQAFDEHLQVVRDSLELLPVVEAATDLIEQTLRGGGTVFCVGNGGSAADAQHLASELVGRFERDRRPWSAIALTVDPSTLTSLANDFGFDGVFERQVRAHARRGDLLVAISTSGTSANVVAAAGAARDVGCRVLALTGAGTEGLGSSADVHLAVPSRSVARVQEVHILMLHAIVGEVERRLEQP